MLKYLAKRIFRSLITLFIVITIVFSLLRLMPVEGYFDNFDKMSEEQLERELTRMGLTDPLPTQLLHFYDNLLHGDLGSSSRYRPGVAITEILTTRFPISMTFGCASMALSMLLGIPLGALMARCKDRFHRLYQRRPFRRILSVHSDVRHATVRRQHAVLAKESRNLDSARNLALSGRYRILRDVAAPLHGR